MRIGFLALCALFLLAAPAAACLVDSDCAPGSHCVRSGGSLHGICTGGTNPRVDRDRQPVEDPFDPNRRVGKSCQLDAECGPGHRCIQSAGKLLGVCVR